MLDFLWRTAVSAFTGFFSNRLSTCAAAMAFYTLFALGPIMIFSIAVAEPIVGRLMAQQAIFEALGTVIDAEQKDATRSIRESHQGFQNPFRGGEIALELQRFSFGTTEEGYQIHNSAFYSEAARKSIASEFKFGIGCSSNDGIWLWRRISSIKKESARRFVEPTRTKTPSSAPSGSFLPLVSRSWKFSPPRSVKYRSTNPNK